MCQRSNLLHEKVDVHLCVVHDEAMWMFEPRESFIHRHTVDVDPTSSSRSQEVSEPHTNELQSSDSKYKWCISVCLCACKLTCRSLPLSLWSWSFLHAWCPHRPARSTGSPLAERQAMRCWVCMEVNSATIVQENVTNNERLFISWLASVENQGPWQYFISLHEWTDPFPALCLYSSSSYILSIPSTNLIFHYFNPSIFHGWDWKMHVIRGNNEILNANKSLFKMTVLW